MQQSEKYKISTLNAAFVVATVSGLWADWRWDCRYKRLRVCLGAVYRQLLVSGHISNNMCHWPISQSREHLVLRTFRGTTHPCSVYDCNQWASLYRKGDCTNFRNLLDATGIRTRRPYVGPNITHEHLRQRPVTCELCFGQHHYIFTQEYEHLTSPHDHLLLFTCYLCPVHRDVTATPHVTFM